MPDSFSLRHRSATCICLLLLLLLIATGIACREDPVPAEGEEVTTTRAADVSSRESGIQPSTTPTKVYTPTPSQTPAPTPTPTITPTPTPTAPPLETTGDPLASAVRNPAPQAGAPCGVVDLLDFPLDPPDAINISRGGQDFNVFRDRYDGYHTGEDWWGPGGRGGSFGEPVYSIGHGQVTFAHPFGWGIDQGTIIIRHVFPDGREFYSFYGHLDPPSVELNYGQCVTRGQKIAEIGDPRGSPHLHFEMRNHTPADPGPGYWSHDPRRSGWFAPSQTIWTWRIGVSPGIVWQRTDSAPGLQGAGLWQEDTLVALDGSEVVGYNLLDGTVRWRLTVAQETEGENDEELLAPLSAAAFDTQEPLLYTADQRGRISALRLPVAASEGEPPSEPQVRWDLQLHNVHGKPELMSLPSGGVVLTVQRRMIAFTAAGALLWREPFRAQPVDWLPWQDSVLLSATGDDGALWEINAQGRRRWRAEGAGQLVDASGRLFLYDGQAVYRLDPQTTESTLFFELPDGLASQGDLLALPDGGLLLAHMDADGRRLLSLDSEGALRWQRVYGETFDGTPRLLLSANHPYLFSEEGNGSWSRVYLHRVNLQSEALTLVFSGGTRTPLPGGTWLFGGKLGQFFINIGGGSLLSLDAGAALQVVCGDVTQINC